MGAWLTTDVPNTESMAKLCEICAKLDIHRITNPFHPCREPLPCSTPPIKQFGTYLALGSVDAIKGRRFACDVCRLIADCLDKEPEGLDGECRITESAEFCNFQLPPEVLPTRDPSITHIHLTQVNVIFDTVMADQFQGPSLPWELKARDSQSTHYVLNFQAKARSCVDAENTSVSPQTEEEFLDTIGGRRVGTQVDLQFIRAWLHQCESEHGKECMPSVKLPQYIDKEPTFVIDVIGSCLVNTPSRCRYVALSYVWGTAPVFRHLTENTADLRKAGSLRSLPIPATIRDSITLVHDIGERYLWVDSLCIIQDDLKMQQEEITRMAAIYSKALFTIIAAAGDNASSGLPGVQPGSREQMQRVLKLGGRELLTVVDKKPSRIDDTIWAQRAWTFQERILSNRILVFSDTQVYWSCRSTSHSEERALERVLSIDRRHPSFSQRYSADTLSWEPLEPLDYSSIYDDLLSNYRQRRLTYQTDLLNAFDGVSQILGAFQTDTFLWGLPESLFSYALTWNFAGHSSRNNVEVPIFSTNGAKQTVPFPSWSWAAWSCKNPKDTFLRGGESSHVRPVVQFYIVDKEHRLVSIKERSWEDQPSDSTCVLWQDHQPSPPLSLPQDRLLQIGQLHFWTSCANVEAIRRWRVEGPGQVEYTLFPPAGYQPDPSATHYHTEIVQQDFIVVAACNPKKLVLLAVEWKDGIAYREGQTQVEETDWVGIEHREWRLIALG